MYGGVSKRDSQFVWVSSLSDDPCELHLPSGVDLKPVVSLLWLCAPRATVHVVVVIRALWLTRALLRPPFSSRLLNKSSTYAPHFPQLSYAVQVSDQTCVYLHVESSSLSREAMVGLRGGQQLVVFHPVGLQAQRRTLWGEKQGLLGEERSNSKHPTDFLEHF